MEHAGDIDFRECTTLDELGECVRLQKQVFDLPETELSPVRHFVVTKNAGGWTLGAFAGGELVGFALSVPAFLRGERAFYSHMAAVRQDFQGAGVGASLKWKQRERALTEGVNYIKWTFEPMKARNAYFNLEKLGAVVREYMPNFYGTDYGTTPGVGRVAGLDSDRLFAEWELSSERTNSLAGGDAGVIVEPVETIEIVPNWLEIVDCSPTEAIALQNRVRQKFQDAFARGLVCRRFARDNGQSKYLLYSDA